VPSVAGVIVTAFLGSSGQIMTMAGFQIGTGEICVAIAAIIGSIDEDSAGYAYLLMVHQW